MNIRPFQSVLLVLVAVTSAGCPTGDEGPSAWSGTGADTGGNANVPPEEVDVCDEGLARIAECGLTLADTPYAAYFRQDACMSECEAACIAEADCEELDARNDAAWSDGDGCDDWGSVAVCVATCTDCDTPLVLSFDGGPVHFRGGGGRFDFGAGPVATDWPAAVTPWLALDRDGNGRIDDATELFGDATPLRAGGPGANGFVPLAELDATGDGRLDARDPAWTALLLWGDHDGDRVSGAGELRTLVEAGVTSIALGYRVEPRCDARGNCERERAPFVYRGADGVEREGAVIDVYLRRRVEVVAAAEP